MKTKTKPTASKPHPTSRTSRSYELVVRVLPYPKPITPEQRHANKTPALINRRFPTVSARTIDAAKKEARRVLLEEGFAPLFVSFADGGRITAVVAPKTEKKGPSLPLSRLRK